MDYISLAAGLIALGLIGFTVYSLQRFSGRLSQLLENLTAYTVQQQKEAEKNGGTALKLQAYERLSLLMERVSVQNLLLRNAPGEQTANAYMTMLLLTIRNEFEFNVTQQVYVSDQLWLIVLQARDNVSQLITRATEGAENGKQVANRLRHMAQQQPADPIAMAQSAIRREAATVV
ncbi:hypothetical protein CEQ90_09410 [Lewinellaceae bacterium SD302]|nr:hypothetical protein CEQ90_09410 [Lewinellaceae bacterium SD302]